MADATTFNTSGIPSEELERIYSSLDVSTPEEVADLMEDWLKRESDSQEIYKQRVERRKEHKKLKLK